MKSYIELMSRLMVGDAILTRDKRFGWGDFIELFTGSKVSHVSMYIGDGLVVEYEDKKGAHISKVEKYFNKRYAVYVRRVKNVTDAQIKDVVNKALNDVYNNEPYDRKSFFGFIVEGITKFFINAKLKKNPVEGKGKVCSTGYASWYDYVNIKIVKDGEELESPDDILKSRKLKTIGVIE